jgi:hypothetical protein
MEPQLFELIAFGLLAIISGLVYRAKYKQYRLRPFPELRRRVLPSFLIGTASLFLFFLAWSDISGNLSWGVLIFLFVTMAIIGMLYKIVPFLVWYKAYSGSIGLRKVPALSDLYSTRLQVVGFWIYGAGLACTVAAILAGHGTGVRIGCSLLLASVSVLIVNLGVMMSHLRRPRTEPIPSMTEKPLLRAVANTL